MLHGIIACSYLALFPIGVGRELARNAVALARDACAETKERRRVFLKLSSYEVARRASFFLAS